VGCVACVNCEGLRFAVGKVGARAAANRPLQ
jgi:hypothetical protein